MEHILLKFISKKEYLEDFLDGKLYMNSLYYFWNQSALDYAKTCREKELKDNPNLDPEKYVVPITGGPGPGQIDLFEGVAKTVVSEESNLPDEMKTYMLMDTIYRSVGMGYCNVLCFYKMDYELINNGTVCSYSLGNMQEFGEYAVIVDDKDELIRRIKRAAEKRRFKYLCGTVLYKKPKLNGKNARKSHNIVLKCDKQFEIEDGYGDAFVKMDNYAYQKEWRVALYRGEKDTEAYILDVGNIRDIVHWVRSKDLNDEVRSMFRRRAVKKNSDCWQGNIDRRELRNLFYQLGDNKAEMMVVLG